MLAHYTFHGHGSSTSLYGKGEFSFGPNLKFVGAMVEELGSQVYFVVDNWQLTLYHLSSYQLTSAFSSTFLNDLHHFVLLYMYI